MYDGKGTGYRIAQDGKWIPDTDARFSRDSAGRELSPEQQEFFKDSKVVDNRGRLKVVYHGTTAQFNTFKRGDISKR